MDRKGYRKCNERIIDAWLGKDKKELKPKVWYVYLLLEKATVDLRADPVTISVKLIKNNVFDINDVMKMNRSLGYESHDAAIRKVIEIHNGLSEENRTLLKGLGYLKE